MIKMKTVLYQINSRELTAFSALPYEFSYETGKNYLFDLSYLTGIQITGDRSQEFLQGQLSCDLREVSQHQFRQGALCNLQGRILTLVDIVNWGTNSSYQLILPIDLMLKTQTSLAKPATLSRVTISHATGYQLFGLYVQNKDDLIPLDSELSNIHYSVVSQETFCCYCLGHNFYIFLIPDQYAPEVREQFIKRSQWRGSLAWHALQLKEHSIQIYPNSRGLFLPHRVGLQLSGHLSFNKGCYKGQEIIARTHYRAKLKHELRLFIIQTDVILQSGQRLFDDMQTIEIGELIDYCPLGDNKFLIAASVIFEHPSTVCIEHDKALIELIPA